jgi:hypothetical protein
MAIFFETKPFNISEIEKYDDSARVSLESDGKLVVKSGILPCLGYALWALPRPKQAHERTEKVKQALKKGFESLGEINNGVAISLVNSSQDPLLIKEIKFMGLTPNKVL